MGKRKYINNYILIILFCYNSKIILFYITIKLNGWKKETIGDKINE